MKNEEEYEGWMKPDQICSYVGGITWKTIKKWHKKFSFPIRYLPGGIPRALQSEIDLWIINFDEIKKCNIGIHKTPTEPP
jgi:hypothetical protein